MFYQISFSNSSLSIFLKDGKNYADQSLFGYKLDLRKCLRILVLKNFKLVNVLAKGSI